MAVCPPPHPHPQAPVSTAPQHHHGSTLFNCLSIWLEEYLSAGLVERKIGVGLMRSKNNSQQRHMGLIGFALTYSYSAMPLVKNRREQFFASNVMQVFSGCLRTFWSDFPKPVHRLRATAEFIPFHNQHKRSPGIVFTFFSTHNFSHSFDFSTYSPPDFSLSFCLQML